MKLNYVKRMTVGCVCPFCHKRQEVEVDTYKYILWNAGGLLIQDAFPELSPSERELLMTGICNKCWPSEDDDDWDEDEFEEDPEAWLDEILN